MEVGDMGMPRVIPSQKNKFQSDEFFRKLSRETEVKYIGKPEATFQELQILFRQELNEGQTCVGFSTQGINFYLNFAKNPYGNIPEDKKPCRETVNFDVEQGKVHLRSKLIVNGVCVLWKGVMDLQQLDGTACLEFDEENATREEQELLDHVEAFNRRRRDDIKSESQAMRRLSGNHRNGGGGGGVMDVQMIGSE